MILVIEYNFVLLYYSTIKRLTWQPVWATLTTWTKSKMTLALRLSFCLSWNVLRSPVVTPVITSTVLLSNCNTF